MNYGTTTPTSGDQQHSVRRQPINTNASGRNTCVFDNANPRNSVALSGITGLSSGSALSPSSDKSTSGSSSGSGNNQVTTNGAGRLPSHEIRRLVVNKLSNSTFFHLNKLIWFQATALTFQCIFVFNGAKIYFLIGLLKISLLALRINRLKSVSIVRTHSVYIFRRNY